MNTKVLSAINLITYFVLGIFLAVFGASTYTAMSFSGVFGVVGAVLFFLVLALGISYCTSQIFPDRRDKQFAILFAVFEVFAIVIISFAGMELCVNTMYEMGTSDAYHISSIAASLTKGENVLRNNAAMSECVMSTPVLYGNIKLTQIIFALFGSKESCFTVLYSLLHLLCGLFTYGVSRLAFGRTSGIITYALVMMTPVQISNLAIRNIYLLPVCLLMAHLCLFLLTRRLEGKKQKLAMGINIAASVILGFAAFLEPVFILIAVLEYVYIFCINSSRENESKGKLKDKIIVCASNFIVLMVFFWGLVGLKCAYIGQSFGVVVERMTAAYIPEKSLWACVSKIWGNTFAYADSYLYYFTPQESRIFFGMLLGFVLLGLLLEWLIKQERNLLLRVIGAILAIICTLKSGMDGLIMIIPFLCVFCGSFFEDLYLLFRVKAYDKLQTQRQLELSVSQASSLKEIEAKEKEQEENRVLEQRELEISEAVISSDNELIKEMLQNIPEEKVPEENIHEENIPEDNIPEKEEYEELPDTGQVITIDDVILNSDSQAEDEAEMEDYGIDENGFLINHMPVPERHEIRNMEFDFEISDDDDFDH